MNSIEAKRQKLKKTQKKNEKIDIENNNNICIDILYEKKMIYFKELQEIILPKKQNELKILLENKTQNSYSINSKISQLENEINDIVSRKEEEDYYLTTMGLFKNYYDYLDSEESNNEIQVFGKKNIIDNKKNIYLDKYNDITNKEIVLINKQKIDTRKKNKGINSSSITLKCINELCYSFDKIIQTKDSYVCSECGIVQGTIISNTLSYNESKNHIKIESLDYKRFNYFKEILLQIQGNELTEIPQEIIDKIINELSKENFTDLNKLTIEKTKNLLKKTGNSKWYEHTSVIMMRLTNRKPIIIPVEIQEKLFYMFHQIDNNFDKHKFRSSFFSYFYIIHKLLELLNLTEYYSYFPYLDDREKLHFQDIMWKVVVEELKNENYSFNRFNIDWRYIKST